MKRISSLIITVVCLLNNSFAQQSHDNTHVESNQITIGVKDTIFSKTLNEKREIWVHLPSSHVYGIKYPVIYLLDGEYNFESVVGIVKANVSANIIPEMIVVAIPNTNRYRDLSTSHIGDESNPSGGAEKFTQFIEDELIPFIDQEYPTIPYRTLIGHSLGGLFVSNVLLNHSHLFNNYLAIDPSLSWDNQKLLKEARKSIKNKEFESKSIYVAIANTLNGKMDYDSALQDTTTGSLHLRSIKEFSELADSNSQLNTKWKYYEEETHGSLPVIAEHEAIRFLFSWYKFTQWDKFYAPKPELSGDELTEIIVSYYEKISNIMGHQIYPENHIVNRVGRFFLDKKDYERAFPLLKLNVENFPESARANNSMGDYYIAVSDTSNAIKYLSKSMEHGGRVDTEEKLELLKKGK